MTVLRFEDPASLFSLPTFIVPRYNPMLLPEQLPGDVVDLPVAVMNEYLQRPAVPVVRRGRANFPIPQPHHIADKPAQLNLEIQIVTPTPIVKLSSNTHPLSTELRSPQTAVVTLGERIVGMDKDFVLRIQQQDV